MDRFSLPAHSVGSVCSLSLLPLPLFPPCRWMEWPCRSPSWRSRSMAKITTCAFISARRKEEEGTTGEWDRREKKNHRPHLQQSTRRRKLEGEEETERAERGGEWKHRIEPTHPIIITVIVISFGPASLLFLILALLLFATTGSCHLSISVLGCLSASLILRSFSSPVLTHSFTSLSRQLFRKQRNASSVASLEEHIRTEGSYIYEECMGGGKDYKLYTIGPRKLPLFILHSFLRLLHASFALSSLAETQERCDVDWSFCFVLFSSLSFSFSFSFSVLFSLSSLLCFILLLVLNVS